VAFWKKPAATVRPTSSRFSQRSPPRGCCTRLTPHFEPGGSPATRKLRRGPRDRLKTAPPDPLRSHDRELRGASSARARSSIPSRGIFLTSQASCAPSASANPAKNQRLFLFRNSTRHQASKCRHAISGESRGLSRAKFAKGLQPVPCWALREIARRRL
jgi:hypothetical protein